MGISVDDVWLEGEHPDTEVVVVVQIDAVPTGSYVYRDYLWYPGTDSNPEMQVGPIVTSILESSPWDIGRGRHPEWTHEPRRPKAGAAPRRPDLNAPADKSHPGRLPDPADGQGRPPWPSPPESDSDLHERCLLSLFQGEWPGFRAHIEDAWLEHEYPDTMIALALRTAPGRAVDARGPGLPVEHLVHRTEVWRKPPLPAGAETMARHVGDIVDDLVEWSYLVKRGRLRTYEIHETRAANPGATRRRPRLIAPG